MKLSVLMSIVLGCAVARIASAQPVAPADQPVPRSDRNSQIAHQQLVEKARRGRIDLYFVGDSITRRWGATDYPEFLANWRQNFHGWNAGKNECRKSEERSAPRNGIGDSGKESSADK